MVGGSAAPRSARGARAAAPRGSVAGSGPGPSSRRGRGAGQAALQATRGAPGAPGRARGRARARATPPRRCARATVRRGRAGSATGGRPRSVRAARSGPWRADSAALHTHRHRQARPAPLARRERRPRGRGTSGANHANRAAAAGCQHRAGASREAGEGGVVSEESERESLPVILARGGACARGSAPRPHHAAAAPAAGRSTRESARARACCAAPPGTPCPPRCLPLCALPPPPVPPLPLTGEPREPFTRAPAPGVGDHSSTLAVSGRRRGWRAAVSRAPVGRRARRGAGPKGPTLPQAGVQSRIGGGGGGAGHGARRRPAGAGCARARRRRARAPCGEHGARHRGLGWGWEGIQG
jgi:hypothetical protein